MQSDTAHTGKKAGRISQSIDILSAVLISGFFGSNIATLTLLKKPSSAMSYV